jgi:hypothetical protein
VEGGNSSLVAKMIHRILEYVSEETFMYICTNDSPEVYSYIY